MVTPLSALDRCNDYTTDVRIQHYKYFGIGYPYYYGVAQLEKESRCRPSARAFDGGMGIAQFMPRTWTWVKKELKEPNLNPYRPDHALKAQAYYMWRIHKNNFSNCKNLWLTYQAYNGGWKWLKKEYERANNILDWGRMKSKCKRKVITLKSGSKLDFCEVNYDYSKWIHKHAEQYRTHDDGKWRYW